MATAEDNTWPPSTLNLCRTGRQSSYDGVSCFRRNQYGTPTKDEDCMCSRAYDKWFIPFKHQHNYGYRR